MNEHELFYLVWNPASGYTNFRHPDMESAKAEAKRLATENKGQEFHVLASVGRAVVREPVDWMQIPFYDMPF